MRGSDDLFKLIKSLDKNEKRYFKLLTGKYETARESNYLKLFDALDGMDEYDEEKLRKRFRDKKMIKNLASEKNHLQRLILRSLRNYSPEPTIDNRIKDMLREADFLYKKALYEACWKTLTKAKELSIQYEKYLLLLEIYEIEGQLLLNTENQEELDKHLDEDFRVARESIEKACNAFEYRLNHIKAFSVAVKMGDDARNKEMMARLLEIRSLPMYRDENKALSFEARYYFLFIHFVHYRTKRDTKNTLFYAGKILELYEKNKMIAAEKVYQHITALSNYSLALVDLGLYYECLEACGRMAVFRHHSPFLRIKVESTIYPRTLACFIHSGKFERIHEVIGALRSFLRKHKGQFNKSKEMTIIWNITLCYYGLGNYKEAIHWLNLLMNDDELHKSRPEMQNYARIFNILIHYELGNYDLIEHLLKSTGRFLNRRHTMYKIEKCALDFFTVIIDIASEKEKKEAIRKFKEDIERLKNTYPDENTFDAVDFVHWAESKLSGKPFPDIIREYAQQEREDAIKLLGGSIPPPPWKA